MIQTRDRYTTEREKKERKSVRQTETEPQRQTDRQTDWLSPCGGDLVCATDCGGLGGGHCLTS